MSANHPFQMPLYVIGLMSGTSADGIDAALVKTDGTYLERTTYTLHQPYRDEVAEAIHRARRAYNDYLSDKKSAGWLALAIAEDHATAVQKLVAMASDISPDIIGFHGQTLYHNPQMRQTIQLGDAGTLSQLTGLPVIYDFRAADIAAGGQGAPLAPIYHQMLLSQAKCDLPAGFLNIGGVANLSYCDASGYVEGYDIGPGNGLLDDFVCQHFALPFDDRGKLAAQGRPSMPFIQTALSHPFFSQSGPRSLDRNEFDSLLNIAEFTSLSVYDQIASLTCFTAYAIELAIHSVPVPPKIIVAAGGGIYNDVMMGHLKDRLGEKVRLVTAEHIGAPSDMVEAELIGFLAARYIADLPSSFPSTTGVASPQICGKLLYPSQRPKP